MASQTFPTVGVGSAGLWAELAKEWLVRNRWGVNFHPGPIQGPFDAQAGRAARRAKWYLGYPIDQCDPMFGPALHSFLVPKGHPHYQPQTVDMWRRRVVRRDNANPFLEARLSTTPWPFRSRSIGELNGCPYMGTHTRGNWESDNAVDLNAPYGTPVIGIWDGVIGSQIGPIYSSDPHLLGERLHLQRVGGDNEAYYAHLSRIDVHAGQRVERGQLLGLSGSAAGVEHLHISVERGRPQDILGIDGCG